MLLWTGHIDEPVVGRQANAPPRYRSELSPGVLFTHLRDALVDERDGPVDATIPHIPVEGYKRPKGTDPPSALTKLTHAMQIISGTGASQDEGIGHMLNLMYDGAGDLIAHQLTDLIQVATGVRADSTATGEDFRNFMKQFQSLEDNAAIAQTVEFVKEGSEIRQKIEAARGLITERKAAMGRVHCPVRFQGNYISETLEDLKKYASELAANGRGDVDNLPWLKSALCDQADDKPSSEDVRLTQIVAIRTDFDMKRTDERNERLRAGACQSIQFAANVNPIIQAESKPDLQCGSP